MQSTRLFPVLLQTGLHFGIVYLYCSADLFLSPPLGKALFCRWKGQAYEAFLDAELFAPELSKALGLPPAGQRQLGQALREELAVLPGAPELVLCGYTPQVRASQRRVLSGTACLALPAAGGKQALARALAEERPDLVLLFGTESEHALWVLECFDPARILVYIQGLAGPCGQHMADGLPPRFCAASLSRRPWPAAPAGATVRQLAARAHRPG